MAKRLTCSEFIKKANIIHHNLYDYSLVNYINSRTKIKIICLKHGIFEILPTIHLAKQGCKKCAHDRFRKTKSDFVFNANKVHNNKYDYSLVEYINKETKVKIICKEHGIFEQSYNSHITQHCGCPKCSVNIPYSTSSFIKKASKVHKSKYDYSLVDYKNSHSKIKIICSEHGVFEQLAYSHLAGNGCFNCFKRIKSSKGEKEVLEYIKSIYSGKIIENDRNQIKPKELDIFLPDLKVGIEYNGEYWHRLKEERNPGHHKLKENICAKREIILINIWENDWINNREEVKEKLSLKIYQLNKNNNV